MFCRLLTSKNRARSVNSNVCVQQIRISVQAEMRIVFDRIVSNVKRSIRRIIPQTHDDQGDDEKQQALKQCEHPKEPGMFSSIDPRQLLFNRVRTLHSSANKPQHEPDQPKDKHADYKQLR